MPDDHQPQLQAKDAKQPLFRWQLGDVLTLFIAFAFTAVGVGKAFGDWPQVAAGVVVGWWMLRCIRAGRQPSGYQLAVVCVSMGVYLVVVGIIKRLMERGFS